MAVKTRTPEIFVAPDEDHFEIHAQGTCRCGGHYELGNHYPAGLADPNPYLHHSLPLCKSFIDLDPLVYLTWNRNRQVLN